MRSFDAAQPHNALRSTLHCARRENERKSWRREEVSRPNRVHRSGRFRNGVRASADSPSVKNKTRPVHGGGPAPDNANKRSVIPPAEHHRSAPAAFAMKAANGEPVGAGDPPSCRVIPRIKGATLGTRNIHRRVITAWLSASITAPASGRLPCLSTSTAERGLEQKLGERRTSSTSCAWHGQGRLPRIHFAFSVTKLVEEAGLAPAKVGDRRVYNALPLLLGYSSKLVGETGLAPAWADAREFLRLECMLNSTTRRKYGQVGGILTRFPGFTGRCLAY
jgi:hypothetical protein